MSATLAAYLARLDTPVPAAAAAAQAADAPARPRTLRVALRAQGLWQRTLALVGIHVLETALLLAGWGCIGFGALSGRVDFGWLSAWALALASTVPLRALTVWLQGTLTLDFGVLLRRLLLEGAMSLDADALRSRGAGAFLGETLEAEAIDDVGASAVVATLLALAELCVTPFLLAWGAAPALQVIALLGMACLSLVLVVRNTHRLQAWTRQRMRLTGRLTENMVAHRTRLVQELPGHWHAEEDQELAAYHELSCRLDAATARIEAALPRAYVVVAFAILAWPFAAGAATLAQLAVSLGAILYAYGVLGRLGLGISDAATAWVARGAVQPLLDAAARTPGAAGAAPGCADPAPGATVLQARRVTFLHPGRPDPALRDLDLTVRAGDQILLEGSSGSGKSTLAAVLTGTREPSSGFVLSRGLDRRTLGAHAWLSRVALAPQYHENHILSAPLLFNLLLSRAYPPSPADVQEATALCHELGLGELLARMPSGINQFVGDTGWRLSQGERSRIFLARALLQRADLTVLDESLAALDPQNLRQCLECVMRRAPTLMLIAHP